MAGENDGLGSRLRSRLIKNWFTVQSSYWFVPTLMVLVAVPLALGLAYLSTVHGIENRVVNLIGPLRWVIGTTAASARSMLETIAGGMISMAAVSYSMTLVVLTLASSQYGPRILHLFVEDRANQAVLGTLVSLAIYCLVLLSVVGEPGTGQTVPQIAVLVAFLWALLNLGAFIFFFHHVVESIRAPEIIEKVGRELRELTASLPEETEGYEGKADREEALRRIEGLPHVRLPARKSGYVQVIDLKRLAQLAEENDLTFLPLHMAGDWVIEGTAMLEVYGQGAKEPNLDDALKKEVHRALVVGDRRTPIQDFSFGIYQLEEIALRALSPSINDPHTAINCINQLGDVLAYLAHAYSPNSVRLGEDGRPLVIRQITDYSGLLHAAFTNIRIYGSEDITVVSNLLRVIEMLIPLSDNDVQRDALRTYAELVARSAMEKTTLKEDREAINERLNAMRELESE